MSRPLPFLMFSLLLLGGCGSEETDTDVSAFIVNGENFVEQGQYRAALIEVRNALQKNPASGEAQVLSAQILNELGQSRQALEALDRVENYKAPDYFLERARAFLNLRKYRSATDLLEAEREGALATHGAAVEEILAYAQLGLGNVPAAETHFNNVLLLDPDSAEAQVGLARLTAIRGDMAGALSAVDTVLAKAPANVDGVLLKATILAQQDDLEGAEETLTNLVQVMPSTDVMTPQRSLVLNSLKEVLTRQGRTGEALIYQRMLAEAFPGMQEIEEKIQSAMELFREGKLTEARALLQEVKNDAPNSDTAGTLLGVISYLQGENEVASEYFEGTLDPETATPEAMKIYASAELRLNQPDKVLAMLDKDIDNTADAGLIALYAIAAFSSGQRDKGEAALKRAVALDPDNARIRLLSARFYNTETTPDRDAALAELERAYAAQPNDPYVQSSYIQQLVFMEQFDDAKALAADIIDNHGDAIASHLLAGTLYDALDDARTALGHFKKALTIDGGDIRALYGTARSQLKLGETAAAATHYEKIIARDADQATAYKGLITAYEMEERGTVGVERLRQLAEANGSAVPYLVLAEYYGRNRDLDKAEEMLALATAREPESPQARQLTVGVYLERTRDDLSRRDWAGARSHIFAALEVLPSDPRFLALLAQTELQADQPREAAKVIEQLRELQPGTALVAVLDGDLASDREDFGAAARAYRRAWEIQPNDNTGLKLYGMLRAGATNESPDAFLNEWEAKLPRSGMLGMTRAGRYMELGNSLEATRLYEQILEIQPNSAIALNNLAWLYEEEQPQRALEVAKRAYEIAGNSPEIIDTYGWFLYKSGDAKEAATLLEEAATLAPDNRDIKAHLDEVRASL